MAGLGTTTMQPGTESPEDERAEPMEGGQNATPEEQALYQKFVETAGETIYPQGGKVSPQILADLHGQFDKQALALFEGAEPPLSGSPADNVAATAVVLTLVVDGALGYSRQAQQAGQQQSESEPNEEAPGQPEEDRFGMADPGEQEDEGPDYAAVILHAGKAIIEELVEVAEAAKLHDFAEQDMEGIVYRAMDLYRVASENSGNPGFDKAGLTREFEGLVAADQQGQASRILPGLPGGAPLPAKGA